MTIVLWTGLLSFFTEYIALIVITIFIVDFFSYRSMKAKLMAAFYFIPFSIIHLVLANYVLQLFNSGQLSHLNFLHAYSNVLLALSVHVFFGLVILCFHLTHIIPAATSLVDRFQNRTRKSQRISTLYQSAR